MQKEKRTQKVGANRNSSYSVPFFFCLTEKLFQFYSFIGFKRANRCKIASQPRPSGNISVARFGAFDVLMCFTRTTWNEECLRKAVATIGKEFAGFGGVTIFGRFKSWCHAISKLEPFPGIRFQWHDLFDIKQGGRKTPFLAHISNTIR